MRKIIFGLLLVVLSSAAYAAPIDEARRFYKEGKYEEVLKITNNLVKKKSGQYGNANYFHGASLVALGRSEEAIEYLQVAEEREVAEAAMMLAEIYTKEYFPTEALAHYDAYEKIVLGRKKNNEVPASVAEARSHLVLMENMLSRVEQVEIIDSLTVDAQEFFKAYRLAPQAGKLVSGATVMMPDVEMAYVPQNNTTIYYSQADSLGNFKLMCADILDDGSFDRPKPLPGLGLDDGGNAEYPFLMSDGLTLYFARDGEGSLGGYDIYLTHRDDEGFLLPQNLGMPYNSPDDDYMMAIDETTGVGWWATDRNHIPGKLTIYVFVPSPTRVNVEPNNPDLRSLARLSDISLTRLQGVDYNAVLQRIDEIGNTTDQVAEKDVKSFELAIGSANKVYSSLSDFRSRDAAVSMTQAVDAMIQIKRLSQRLATLRQQYAAGDRSNASEIINLESQLEDARQRLYDKRNEAIYHELNHKKS